MPWDKDKAREYRKKRMREDPAYRAKRRAAEQRRKKRKRLALSPEERKEAYRVRHLWREFGMRPEEYDRLLAAQGGVCAICKETCPVHDNMGVDHDHATGQIRGVLCLGCNAGIGDLRDDPALLLEAIAYLADPPGLRILGPAAKQEVLSI